MRSTVQSKRESRKRGKETNVSRLEQVEHSVRGDVRRTGRKRSLQFLLS